MTEGKPTKEELERRKQCDWYFREGRQSALKEVRDWAKKEKKDAHKLKSHERTFGVKDYYFDGEFCAFSRVQGFAEAKLKEKGD